MLCRGRTRTGKGGGRTRCDVIEEEGLDSQFVVHVLVRGNVCYVSCQLMAMAMVGNEGPR